MHMFNITAQAGRGILNQFFSVQEASLGNLECYSKDQKWIADFK